MEEHAKAVEQLNALQSNAEVLQKLQGDQRKQLTETNVEKTIEFMKYLNLDPLDIDRLNCIHITGTKGKGSTAAFVEAILRNMGFKTGFYSSPHLVNLRERIRINGKCITEKHFAEYVFSTLEALKKNNIPDQELPGYFKFLTLMAFRIFMDAEIDVAIVEVGIGGQNDCTNVLKNPIICACSTLDYDHCRLLGNSLEEIAWQKAGIMKPNSLFLAVKPELQSIIDVLQKRSQERMCELKFVPEITAYKWPKKTLNFGISGKHQNFNVSLALQIARFWIWRTLNNRKFILYY